VCNTMISPAVPSRLPAGEAALVRVLALASYPVEAAATRYRLEQFVGPLAERGITMTIRPFINSKLFAQLYQRDAIPRTAFSLIWSALLRLRDALAAREADVVLVQREAMLFGPPVIEWLAKTAGRCPLVLDLDDATYVPYTSPTYGHLGKWIKCFSKTDDLIRWSDVVTCGNRAIAEYVLSKGTAACIIPTVVDTDVFKPRQREPSDAAPLLGWVGTHSTYPYLESIFPVLEDLALGYNFRLKIVGSGREEVSIAGIAVENLKWSLDREVRDFQSFDIGLYPIDTRLYGDWAAGKSGFKGIQYMAVGIPYVTTPVGASAEIGEVGVTHFNASTLDEWKKVLEILISNRERRLAMGAAGRRHVEEHYNLPDQADKLAAAIRQAEQAKRN
jgi:glycosyltransferase involved in cell wall biosynthesis